jgi:hypothetical protein
MQVDQIVRFVVENKEVFVTFVVSLVAVVKLTAWGKAQAAALDTVVGAIECLGADDVKSKVAMAEKRLAAAAKDALKDAVAKADAKKSPLSAVLKFIREVFRGI